MAAPTEKAPLISPMTDGRTVADVEDVKVTPASPAPTDGPGGAEPMQQKAEPPTHLKLMSLVMVTLQTTTMVVLTRYTRVGTREAYSVCSMVIMSELMKVFLSCGLLASELGGLPKATSVLRQEWTHNRTECLKLLVPAGLYFFQNNVLIFAGAAVVNVHFSFLYVYLARAVTNLNTAQYQVCYQFKLVVTAILSVIMLKRSLTKAQWL